MKYVRCCGRALNGASPLFLPEIAAPVTDHRVGNAAVPHSACRLIPKRDLPEAPPPFYFRRRAWRIRAKNLHLPKIACERVESDRSAALPDNCPPHADS
jgi:hypothetical protein